MKIANYLGEIEIVYVIAVHSNISEHKYDFRSSNIGLPIIRAKY